jgi:hypothetical protein
MRRNVSSEGTPFSSTRNLRNHASLLICPDGDVFDGVAIGEHGAMAITRISMKSCSVPLLGLRGSSTSLKQQIKLAPFVTLISVAQKTRVDLIPKGLQVLVISL